MRTFNNQITKFWHDKKHYDFGKSSLLLGYASQVLPDEMFFPSKVLDQNDGSGRQDCTAFMAVAIRSSMKGKDYNTDRQWELELAFGGNKPAPEGFPLETPFAVAVQSGFVPLGESDPTDRASAYFWVRKSSGLDLFDSIRLAMYQNQCPLGAGLLWYLEYDTKDGIILDNGNHLLGGHAVKIAGTKKINGEVYLIIQNSWGEAYGDKGFFYLSRKMANTILNYGVCYLSDNPNAQIQRLGLLQALYANLLLLIQKAFIYGGFHP